MTLPWKTSAVASGRRAACSASRLETFMLGGSLSRVPAGSAEVEVFDELAGRGRPSGPFRVRRAHRRQVGDLLEPALVAFEQDQPARGDLAVVTPPRGAVGVEVAGPHHQRGVGGDAPGQPELLVAEIDPP